jgi:hypothetical protein
MSVQFCFDGFKVSRIIYVDVNVMSDDDVHVSDTCRMFNVPVLRRTSKNENLVQVDRHFD